MGIGDELMMAGEARRRAKPGQRFRMLDKYGRPKWHPVWEGHPNIARKDEPHEGVIGYENGKRPYIVDISPERYVFREYRPAPAPLKVTPRRDAAGAVVFNPTIKERASPNKNWGIARWQALLELAPDLRWICIGEDPPAIAHAERLRTASFVEACAVIAGARAAVLHEGGLHHASAAVGTKAVVIYGGYISPRVTGYDGQAALYAEDPRYPLGCGQRVPCGHCRAAMESIAPSAVLRALRQLLKNSEEVAAA